MNTVNNSSFDPYLLDLNRPFEDQIGLILNESLEQNALITDENTLIENQISDIKNLWTLINEDFTEDKTTLDKQIEISKKLTRLKKNFNFSHLKSNPSVESKLEIIKFLVSTVNPCIFSKSTYKIENKIFKIILKECDKNKDDPKYGVELQAISKEISSIKQPSLLPFYATAILAISNETSVKYLETYEIISEKKRVLLKKLIDTSHLASIKASEFVEQMQLKINPIVNSNEFDPITKQANEFVEQMQLNTNLIVNSNEFDLITKKASEFSEQMLLKRSYIEDSNESLHPAKKIKINSGESVTVLISNEDSELNASIHLKRKRTDEVEESSQLTKKSKTNLENTLTDFTDVVVSPSQPLIKAKTHWEEDPTVSDFKKLWDNVLLKLENAYPNSLDDAPIEELVKISKELTVLKQKLNLDDLSNESSDTLKISIINFLVSHINPYPYSKSVYHFENNIIQTILKECSKGMEGESAKYKEFEKIAREIKVNKLPQFAYNYASGMSEITSKKIEITRDKIESSNYNDANLKRKLLNIYQRLTNEIERFQNVINLTAKIQKNELANLSTIALGKCEEECGYIFEAILLETAIHNPEEIKKSAMVHFVNAIKCYRKSVNFLKGPRTNAKNEMIILQENIKFLLEKVVELNNLNLSSI